MDSERIDELSLTENDYSVHISDSDSSSDSSDEEIITFTQIRIPHTIQQTTGVENPTTPPQPHTCHSYSHHLRGLPAYQLHNDTQPPSYDTIQPKASTCAKCQTHDQSLDSLQGAQPASPTARRVIWTVLNLTFLSPMLSALATIILYISQLAFQEGDDFSKYTQISFILNIVGSTFGVVGMILYFVLFFTDRLRLISFKPSDRQHPNQHNHSAAATHRLTSHLV